jgi:hypothetical protein
MDKVKKIYDLTAKHFDAEFEACGSVKPTMENTRDPTYKGSRALTHKWESMSFSQDGLEPT